MYKKTYSMVTSEVNGDVRSNNLGKMQKCKTKQTESKLDLALVNECEQKRKKITAKHAGGSVMLQGAE